MSSLLRIEVRPRYVAAPWEVARGEVRRIVGLEAGVAPEEGPHAAYRSVFPDRYVAWDYLHQVFAVRVMRGDTPDPEVDGVHELLAWWDVDPDGDGAELTDEEVAAQAGRNPLVIRRFMPFDYQFVNRRLRERMTFLEAGPARYQRRIADRNAARKRSIARHHALNQAHAAAENRRWIPVLKDYERTGRINPGLRTPMVRGASLTPPPAPAGGIILASR